MNSLKLMEEWYLNQCNEEWEHSFGVSIGTLDNPGWEIKVDLKNTKYFGIEKFEYEEKINDKNEWISIKKESDKIVGFCGPKKLDEMINKIFKDYLKNAG